MPLDNAIHNLSTHSSSSRVVSIYAACSCYQTFHLPIPLPYPREVSWKHGPNAILKCSSFSSVILLSSYAPPLTPIQCSHFMTPKFKDGWRSYLWCVWSFRLWLRGKEWISLTLWGWSWLKTLWRRSHSLKGS